MKRPSLCHAFGLALILLAAGGLRADLIFLKDGHVLQGKVRRESTREVDPVDKVWIEIPRGFFTVDDGPRRIVFSPTQVRIAEKMSAPVEERFPRGEQKLIPGPRRMLPMLEVVKTSDWDPKTWERDFYFRSDKAAQVGLRQAVAEFTPYYAQLDAVSKFKWHAAYLTREFPPELVHKLILAHKSMQESKNMKPGEVLAKRMKLCNFLVQAGWFDLAERELNRLVKDLPEEKERVGRAQASIDRLRARELWEQTKNWYQAGRLDAVRKRLAAFPGRNLPENIQADLREMKARLDHAAGQLGEAGLALDACCKAATTPQGKALASAVAVLRTELNATTVDRLDAFLGQYREAQRQKQRGKTPAMSNDDLLSLAVTGWLLGSPNAEARPESAVSLWKTRQMVLEYLQENDADQRRRILATYEKAVSPRVEFDEVAQLIDTLPPVWPARDVSTERTPVQVGTGRNAITYHLQLPPEYTHTRQYPVLIVLHNAGERATAMLQRWEQAAAEHGYILAAPEWDRGVSDSYGYSEREHDTVRDTLRDLRRRFQVDSDRVFLCGYGEGARMAFDVGLSHPHLFAGVLPVSAGPGYYPRRYWRNAQYLPFYVTTGTFAGDSVALLREQFKQWVIRGFPTLWVEYKGRGTEWFSAEVPTMLDWMRHQRRAFPLHQLGSDGGGSQSGNEFCTHRAEDNRFYWLSTSNISPRNLVAPDRLSNLTQPAMMTGRIDPATNEVVLKTTGLGQVSVWIGRNARGHYMIDLDKPVSVRIGFRNFVNGRRITPSLALLLEELYRTGDRKQLWVGKIDLNLR